MEKWKLEMRIHNLSLVVVGCPWMIDQKAKRVNKAGGSVLRVGLGGLWREEVSFSLYVRFNVHIHVWQRPKMMRFPC